MTVRECIKIASSLHNQHQNAGSFDLAASLDQTSAIAAAAAAAAVFTADLADEEQVVAVGK
jgi:hypothetical protein